jgi:branched-chain amino acid transport system permease protein
MEQMIINGVILGANYALIALGITLIFAIMNILNFAHGQMYMLGGFVVYYLFGRYHVNFLVSLVAAAAVLAGIGVLFEVAFFRRVLRMSTREENSMLGAMGTALVLEAIALVAFGEKQRGTPPIAPGVFKIGDAFIPASRAWVFLIAVILIAALLLFVRYTKPGRALRALAQDKEVTRLMGVDSGRTSALGFGIGAGLAGIAGALLVTIFAVNAGAGTSISVKAFIMIMIGGAGVTWGAILGAFALGLAEAIGYQLIPGTITYLFIFIALILFLIARPQGIMGKPWG